MIGAKNANAVLQYCSIVGISKDKTLSCRIGLTRSTEFCTVKASDSVLDQKQVVVIVIVYYMFFFILCDLEQLYISLLGA